MASNNKDTKNEKKEDAKPAAETKPTTEPVPTATDDEVKKAEAKAAREAKLEALKKKSDASKEKALNEMMKKVELFDSTQASGWKTTGTHILGAMKTEDGSLVVSGKNIGAEQKEPEWSEDQLSVIDKAKTTLLPINGVNNTRRSVIDSNMEFVGRDDHGSIVPTEKAYVSSLDTSQYCIGLGPDKYDVTGSPRYYSDLVVADINGNWLINQWTSEGIILEGVSQQVIMQQNRPGNTSGRKIGVHFVRIGLPAYAFGPMFYSLSQRFPGCMSQVTITRGYYWLNASWGVSSFNATFSYLNEQGKLASLASLADVMRMLNGKSSMCLGTVAISITCPAKMVDGKPVADKETFGLSVKMHNAFHVDEVDFHGPPQQGATGMNIPSRIAQKAKAMISKSSAGMGMSGGIFSPQNTSVFGSAGKSMEVPNNQNSVGKSYM